MRDACRQRLPDASNGISKCSLDERHSRCASRLSEFQSNNRNLRQNCCLCSRTGTAFAMRRSIEMKNQWTHGHRIRQCLGFEADTFYTHTFKHLPTMFPFPPFEKCSQVAESGLEAVECSWKFFFLSIFAWSLGGSSAQSPSCRDLRLGSPSPWDLFGVETPGSINGSNK